MDEQNNDQNQELNQDPSNYITEIDTSNPFSNALKKFSALLQKMNLIKPDQVLIGDKDTNSKGYQTTSKSAIDATAPTSLKGLLRKAFEDHQKKRAQKINSKSTPNKLKVQTVAQAIKEQNTQTVTKDQVQDIINHRTSAQIAVERLKKDQLSQSIIDHTHKTPPTADKEETIDAIDATEIELDESFDSQKRETQDVEQSSLKAENLTVENNPNKIIVPTPKKSVTPRTNDSKNLPEEPSL